MVYDPWRWQRPKIVDKIAKCKRAIVTHQQSLMNLELSRDALNVAIDKRKSHIVCNETMLVTLQAVLDKIPPEPTEAPGSS